MHRLPSRCALLMRFVAASRADFAAEVLDLFLRDGCSTLEECGDACCAPLGPPMSSICSWMLASKDCEWIVNQTTGKDRSGGPLLFRIRVHSCASSSQVAHRRKRSVQALGSVGPTVNAAYALRMGLVQTAVALERQMIVVITRPRQLLVLPSSASVLLFKPHVAEAPPSRKARLRIRSRAVTVTVIASTGSATLPTLSAAA